MKKSKLIVVNLFAGPGAGKSTTCAGIFHELKLKGINCEMALEYAKDKVWEESYRTLENQIYVFGHQLQRIFRVKDKVEVVITDSPLILSIYYDKERSANLKNLVMEQHNQFHNINIFIGRNDLAYNPKGRYQTFEEAKNIDKDLKRLLDSLDVDYIDINKGETEKAVQIILEELNRDDHLLYEEFKAWKKNKK